MPLLLLKMQDVNGYNVYEVTKYKAMIFICNLLRESIERDAKILKGTSHLFTKTSCQFKISYYSLYSQFPDVGAIRLSAVLEKVPV